MHIPPEEQQLAQAAAEFPLVMCRCPTCDRSGLYTDDRGERIPCPECGGSGVYYRSMEKREEHYYLMHLLTTRYQIR